MANFEISKHSFAFGAESPSEGHSTFERGSLLGWLGDSIDSAMT